MPQCVPERGDLRGARLERRLARSVQIMQEVELIVAQLVESHLDRMTEAQLFAQTFQTGKGRHQRFNVRALNAEFHGMFFGLLGKVN